MRQYKVIKAYDIAELESLVQAEINNEWDLQGGVCAIACDDFIIFYQALIQTIEGEK